MEFFWVMAGMALLISACTGGLALVIWVAGRTKE